MNLEKEKRAIEYLKNFEPEDDPYYLCYSGGKDSALVGILCKMACENTLGVLLPCATKQNYGSDTTDALLLAGQYGIESRTVDLTEARNAEIRALEAALGVESENIVFPFSALKNLSLTLRESNFAVKCVISRKGEKQILWIILSFIS